MQTSRQSVKIRSMPRLAVFLLALFMLPGALLRGSTQTSLPLQGYYHPGRYMPVGIQATIDDDRKDLILSADGAIDTHLRWSDGAISAIAPLLCCNDAATSARVHTPHRNVAIPGLHPLADQQKLVVYLGADDHLADRFFLSHDIVAVTLPMQTFHAGPAAAWQTIDALVLDRDDLDRLDPHLISTLLAGGTSIIVRGASAPMRAGPGSSRMAPGCCAIQPPGPLVCLPKAYMTRSPIGRPGGRRCSASRSCWQR